MVTPVGNAICFKCNYKGDASAESLGRERKKQRKLAKELIKDGASDTSLENNENLVNGTEGRSTLGKYITVFLIGLAILGIGAYLLKDSSEITDVNTAAKKALKFIQTENYEAFLNHFIENVERARVIEKMRIEIRLAKQKKEQGKLHLSDNEYIESKLTFGSDGLERIEVLRKKFPNIPKNNYVDLITEIKLSEDYDRNGKIVANKRQNEINELKELVNEGRALGIHWEEAKFLFIITDNWLKGVKLREEADEDKLKYVPEGAEGGTVTVVFEEGNKRYSFDLAGERFPPFGFSISPSWDLSSDLSRRRYIKTISE